MAGNKPPAVGAGMLANMLKMMGINPDEMTAFVQNAQNTLNAVGEQLNRIEANQNEILEYIRNERKDRNNAGSGREHGGDGSTGD